MLALACLVLSQTSVQVPTAQAKTIWAMCRDSVYSVEAKIGSQWQVIGTGFIVDHGTRQYAVTCAHVSEAEVGGKPLESFRIEQNGKSYAVKFTSMKGQDVSAARISGLKGLKVAQLMPQIGDKVFALGFPAGESLTISEGICNRIAKIGDRVMIGHSAAMWFGNSGGCLVNESGDVVGINSNMKPGPGNLLYSERAGDGFRQFLTSLK